LNDVRLGPDGRHAYLTDSGVRGALVVVDLASGAARRLLDGHPSTQPDKRVVVQADGRPLRRPDGRGVEFSADGIALSADGRHLYWQAIKGRTLYRIATEALHDEALAPATLGDRVETVGDNGPADGLLIDRRGRMHVSAVEEDAVKVRDLARGGDRLVTLVQDRRLRWPDTFAEGPDGTIYVTSSRIQDMMWFDPKSGPALRTTLFRIDEGGR
jgi:sugar lactone lactonase YvrE